MWKSGQFAECYKILRHLHGIHAESENFDAGRSQKEGDSRQRAPPSFSVRADSGFVLQQLQHPAGLEEQQIALAVGDKPHVIRAV